MDYSTATQDSLPDGWPALSGREWLPAGSYRKVSGYPSSFPRLRLAHPNQSIEIMMVATASNPSLVHLGHLRRRGAARATGRIYEPGSDHLQSTMRERASRFKEYCCPNLTAGLKLSS